MDPRSIGVAGLGFLGRGIATCLLDHGFYVVGFETDPDVLKDLPSSDRFTLAANLSAFSACELVIESINENFAAKQALFVELEQHVGPTVPIATNTSAIPITLLQTNRKHPNRFAGMHWTAPAYATRFLEIIRGDHTDNATLQHIERLARELDKDPAIVQKDIPGFVANRIAYAMYREAIHLLEEGVADAETIDKLCQHSLGLWTPLCGPFRWMDITGGPTLYAAAMERIVPTLANNTEVLKTMLDLQTADARGTRNGQGFYSYSPNADAEWKAKIHEHALKIWRMGLERETSKMAPLDWSQCPAVESIPGKVSGAWVIKGTRLPASAVFENIEAGLSVSGITEVFDVTEEEVKAVVHFATQSLEKPLRTDEHTVRQPHSESASLSLE